MIEGGVCGFTVDDNDDGNDSNDGDNNNNNFFLKKKPPLKYTHTHNCKNTLHINHQPKQRLR